MPLGVPSESVRSMATLYFKFYRLITHAIITEHLNCAKILTTALTLLTNNISNIVVIDFS